MTNILISILNYNSKDQTLSCLKSLESISHKNFNFKVLVIDNASRDLIEERELKSFKLDIKLITCRINTGFSGGHNIGFKYAVSNGFDYILILNNDTVVQKDFLQNLLVSFKDSKVGAAGSKVYFKKGSEFHKDRYSESDKGRVIWFAGGKVDWDNLIASHVGVDEVDKGQFDNFNETEFLTGCCMLIPVKVLSKVGYFDDRYFLYLEDLDLNMRIKNAGYKLVINPESIIWHKNASSSGGSGSNLQDYYISRNRLIFGMDYAPIKTKVSLIKESLGILRNGREYQRKGVKDFYTRKLGKGTYV